MRPPPGRYLSTSARSLGKTCYCPRQRGPYPRAVKGRFRLLLAREPSRAACAAFLAASLPQKSPPARLPLDHTPPTEILGLGPGRAARSPQHLSLGDGAGPEEPSGILDVLPTLRRSPYTRRIRVENWPSPVPPPPGSIFRGFRDGPYTPRITPALARTLDAVPAASHPPGGGQRERLIHGV